MRRLTVTSYLILLTLSATPLAAQNTVKAVIGLNSSQLIESLEHNTALTLTPIQGSIIPLINSQPIEIGQIIEQGKNWQSYINQTIKVMNRHQPQSYEGRLLSTQNDLFEILVGKQILQLNLEDYNLVRPDTGRGDGPSFNINDKVTYQSGQVSWQPQLSIFLDDEYATLKQNALIRNTSYKDIQLAQPILQLKQYQHSPAPMETLGTNLRSMSMAKDSTGVDYINNEITVPTNQDILLSARQTLLFPFKQQKLKITHSRLIAEHYANPRSSVEQSIQFQQHADLILQQDAMPGSYQTFWHHQDYLLPAGTTELAHLRQGNKVTLKINQSQDIQAYFKLVKASTLKLPATQTWQISLANLSNQNQVIEFYHNANGLITSVKTLAPSELSKLELESASRLKINYLLVPNEKVNIQYEIKVSQ